MTDPQGPTPPPLDLSPAAVEVLALAIEGHTHYTGAVSSATCYPCAGALMLRDLRAALTTAETERTQAAEMNARLVAQAEKMSGELLKAETAAVLVLGPCEPYLKDGETPAECIARNRRDADAVLVLLAKALQRAEALEARLAALTTPRCKTCARRIAARIVASCSASSIVPVIADAILAFPDTTPTVEVLAGGPPLCDCRTLPATPPPPETP
jgi:hypothetical protein